MIIIKRRILLPEEECILAPDETGLPLYISIPRPMRPEEHRRADGLSYVDAVYGQEVDTATIGPNYTGVPAVIELRSIAGDLAYPAWVEGQAPSVRVYATDFNGDWFVLTDGGDIPAIAKEYEPPPLLVEQARQWMALNRKIVARHFLHGGGSRLLGRLRHRLSKQTRLKLALEKFAERTAELGDKVAFNPWKENLPQVRDPEKLAAVLVDLEALRNSIFLSEKGKDCGEKPSAAALYQKQVEGLARLAMINYWLIRGVQEGFILDSLEALDYLVDAKGESTAIEKAAATLRSHIPLRPQALKPGEK